MNLTDRLKRVAPIFIPFLFTGNLAFAECKLNIDLDGSFKSWFREISNVGEWSTIEFMLLQKDGTKEKKDFIYLFLHKSQMEINVNTIRVLLSDREKLDCISYYEMWEKDPDKIKQENISLDFYSKREIIRFNRIWFQLQGYVEETIGYMNKYREKMREFFDPYFDVG